MSFILSVFVNITCNCGIWYKIHMYLKVGMTQILSFGLKVFGAWPEHDNHVLYK